MKIQLDLVPNDKNGTSLCVSLSDIEGTTNSMAAVTEVCANHIDELLRLRINTALNDAFKLFNVKVLMTAKVR